MRDDDEVGLFDVGAVETAGSAVDVDEEVGVFGGGDVDEGRLLRRLELAVYEEVDVFGAGGEDDGKLLRGLKMRRKVLKTMMVSESCKRGACANTSSA